MIQKTNRNMSFKGVFASSTLNSLSPKNIKKLNTSLSMFNKFFPEHDMFISADKKGCIDVFIKKRHPLLYLLEPDIAEKINLSTNELINLVTLNINFERAHNQLWGKKPQVIHERLNDIENYSSTDIFLNIRDMIFELKDKFKDTLN